MNTDTPLPTTADLLGAVDQSNPIRIPFLTMHIPAGFPSPADDHIDRRLDLNELIIKRPAATFFMRAHGTSMKNAGIQTDDILVVDRSEKISDKSIVIAVVDGDFTVKRLSKRGRRTYLMPENEEYEPTEITAETDITIWGVVTHVIHSTKR